MNELLLKYLPLIIVIVFISFSVFFILLIKPDRKIDYKERYINLKK